MCLPRILCRVICAILCILIVVFGIIGIIIAATWRNPDINYKSISIASDPAPSFNPSNGGEFRFAWLPVVEVRNNWRWSLYLDTVAVRTRLAAQPDVSVGSGAVRGINLQPGVASDVAVPLNVQLTTRDQNSLGLLKAFAACAGSSTKVDYEIDVWVKVFGIGPFKVPVKRTADAPCPGVDGLNSLVNVFASLSK